MVATRGAGTGRRYATGPLVVRADESNAGETPPTTPPASPRADPSPPADQTPRPPEDGDPEPGPGVTPVRLSGADRLSTAVAISEAVHPDGADTAVVAAAGAFPDALAAGPLAAAAERPLLLVGRDDVPAAALEALGAERVTIVGRTAVVGTGAATGLDEGRAVKRLAGDSRFATAAAAADAAIDAGADPDVVVVASGGTFADALAAGPAAGARGGVLLLTGGDQLAAPVSDHLRERGARLKWVAVAGGTSVISEAVVAALQDAAGDR